MSMPSEENKDTFFEKLSQYSGSPVILSLIAHYNEAYIPLYETGKIMKPLRELRSPDAEQFSQLQKCEEVFETVSFSFNQAQKVEMTRTLADSRQWFHQ